jgi:2-polyprenyl-3-methyl-5-hydroxy-6-metoxy-1,4-benzoquinol methylase
VDRCSFIAVDLHHLLFAGFDRRTINQEFYTNRAGCKIPQTKMRLASAGRIPSNGSKMQTVADEVFEREFLASLYDYFNLWTPSDEFYLQMARESGGRVLDLGCGTGMLACRIAQEGLSVTGVDPAEGMLRVARSRVGHERVSWIKAAGQSLRLSTHFDLIYMTGHAFQALLSDDDALAVLKAAHDHLEHDGHFAFESRNPARRAWLTWTRAQKIGHNEGPWPD